MTLGGPNLIAYSTWEIRGRVSPISGNVGLFQVKVRSVQDRLYQCSEERVARVARLRILRLRILATREALSVDCVKVLCTGIY